MFGKRESKNKIKTEGGEAPAVQEELYGSNSMNGNSDMENESAGIEEDTYETDGDSPSEIPATKGLARKRLKQNKKRRQCKAGLLVEV
ncbi:MAG: hypothetical protein LUF92_09770, partial [Clostridiales bacterium]|nr:hypothetical protein [Clostridiales bacterium]